VLNCVQLGSSGVAKAGSLSLDNSSSLIFSCIPPNCFILRSTTKGSYGIRLVFRNADLQSSRVKVLSKNRWKREKKLVFDILVALRNTSLCKHFLKLCLNN
jgi:hypothetical protein